MLAKRVRELKEVIVIARHVGVCTFVWHGQPPMSFTREPSEDVKGLQQLRKRVAPKPAA